MLLTVFIVKDFLRVGSLTFQIDCCLGCGQKTQHVAQHLVLHWMQFTVLASYAMKREKWM